jgi:hypothetical protein
MSKYTLFIWISYDMNLLIFLFMATTSLNSNESGVPQKPLLPAIVATPKTGEEPLTAEAGQPVAKFIDFWKWYASGVVSNTMRGYFAEFIISTALNVDLSKNVRTEWGAFDIISPEGIQIEVKSAAFIQSWHQKDFSPIKFSIKQARAWDSTVNYEARENEPSRHADVYVFCLLHHKDQATLNPLDLTQWTFFVLSTAEVNGFQNQKTIALSSLQKVVEGVPYSRLREVIFQKAVVHYKQK